MGMCILGESTCMIYNIIVIIMEVLGTAVSSSNGNSNETLCDYVTNWRSDRKTPRSCIDVLYQY